MWKEGYCPPNHLEGNIKGPWRCWVVQQLKLMSYLQELQIENMWEGERPNVNNEHERKNKAGLGAA